MGANNGHIIQNLPAIVKEKNVAVGEGNMSNFGGCARADVGLVLIAQRTAISSQQEGKRTIVKIVIDKVPKISNFSSGEILQPPSKCSSEDERR